MWIFLRSSKCLERTCTIHQTIACINLKLSGVVLTNITDHCAILNTSRWEDSFGSDRYVTVTKRVLSEEEMNSLTECIAEYSWDDVKNVDCVEDAYSTFITAVRDMYDINCPNNGVRMKKLDMSKPYINKEIKK